MSSNLAAKRQLLASTVARLYLLASGAGGGNNGSVAA